IRILPTNIEMNAFRRYGILNTQQLLSCFFDTGFKKEDVTVKGFIKITLISLGCLLLFIVAPLMITGYYISKSVSNSLDRFENIFDNLFKKEDITVNGFIKIILISLGCLLLFIVATLMITGYYISKSVSDSLESFENIFDTGYTHEEIKKYVQDEHGLEVEIIEN